jgi:hypothetical protein
MPKRRKREQKEVSLSFTMLRSLDLLKYIKNYLMNNVLNYDKLCLLEENIVLIYLDLNTDYFNKSTQAIKVLDGLVHESQPLCLISCFVEFVVKSLHCFGLF